MDKNRRTSLLQTLMCDENRTQNNIDCQYRDTVTEIIRHGHSKGDRTGTGTISRFGMDIRHSMCDGFPLLTTKSVYFPNVETELYWFMRGQTNMKYLVRDGNNIWVGDALKKHNSLTNTDMSFKEFVDKIKTDDEFADKWGELGPVYGHQWRNRDVDQLATAIKQINKSPDSRRIIVNSWQTDDLKYMTLPPCHNEFQFWTRELTHAERGAHYGWKDEPERKMSYDEYLDWKGVPKRELSIRWNQRSVDTGLGLPFNIASYAILLELISRLTNCKSGDIIGHFGDTHIYNNHIDKVVNQVVGVQHKLPQIQISDDVDFDNGLDGMLKTLKKGSVKIINYKNNGKVSLPLSN